MFRRRSMLPTRLRGVFRGRAGSTNAVLTAAEVRRLHDRRAEDQAPSISVLLREFVGLDPTPEDQRRQAHLFIIARPVRADAEMLQEAVGARWEAWSREHVLHPPRLTEDFSPDTGEAHRLFRSPSGWIATSYDAAHQPPEPLFENHGIEVEIGDDGTVKAFCSRASDDWKGGRVAFEILIGGLVRRVLDLGSVITTDAGFMGDWEVAVGISHLRGTVSHFRMRGPLVDVDDCPPFPESHYERTWRGAAAELATPDPIVARLLGGLNRTLNNGKCLMPTPRDQGLSRSAAIGYGRKLQSGRGHSCRP